MVVIVEVEVFVDINEAFLVVRVLDAIVKVTSHNGENREDKEEED